MSRYRIVHSTRFFFDATVTSYALELRVRPRDLPCQQVNLHQLIVRPAASRREETDPFGNHVTLLESAEKLRSLDVHAISEVDVEACTEPVTSLTWETARPCPGNAPASPAAENSAMHDWAVLRGEMATPEVSKLAREYAESSFPAGRSLVDAIEELARRMRTDLLDDPDAVEIAPPLAQVIRLRRGICQDRTRVALACVRSLGLAARYVGGYRIASGVAELHAWCSVWVPGHGWLDLDPSVPSGSGATVEVSRGLDAADAAPVRGLFQGGGRQRREATVTVECL